MRQRHQKLSVGRETIRALSTHDLSVVAGGRNGISEVVGGCTKNTDGWCSPGPASVADNCAR